VSNIALSSLNQFKNKKKKLAKSFWDVCNNVCNLPIYISLQPPACSYFAKPAMHRVGRRSARCIRKRERNKPLVASAFARA
jgi:hypothetical protein